MTTQVAETLLAASQASAVVEAAEAVSCALAAALKTRLAASRVSARSVSTQLGYDPLYLTNVFRGRYRFRVEVLFQVLLAVGDSPFLFLHEEHPFGGPAWAALTGKPPEGSEGSGGSRFLDTLSDRLAAEASAKEPEAYRLRIGELLRYHLRRAGLSQQEASLALGHGPGALGQVLRGYGQLTLTQVFGVLSLLGMRPGRFFLEVFLPTAINPADRAQEADLLDAFGELFAEMSEAFLARREGD